MVRFTEGDRVRVDIPDKSDPDHDQYHGVHGTVVAVLEDHADEVTGDERDTVIYRIDLESGETADFRWRDLRPPIE
jgi:ribosomal protein L21E